jgi:hypothetical protein
VKSPSTRPSASPEFSPGLVIQAVDNHPGRLKTFIRVPWTIYADDPAWVPPLILERRQHLSTRNPFFQHARCRCWVAYRDQRPVGRISAQIDQLHLERYHDATGFFGMIEALDDAALFRALLSTAEAWLLEQGIQRVRGPFNLSINEESGLLVEGFNTPPALMMGHAHPYYATRIEQQDYAPAQDLLAYWLTEDSLKRNRPKAWDRLVSRVHERIQIRPLRRKHFKQDLEILRDIFNDAWSENWGFIPFTRAEFEELGRNIAPLIDDEFVQIAEVDGTPAAMMVMLPNVNEALQDLNGRLLPVGWLKLLWRLKVRYPGTGRIPLMGVRKRYQNSLLGSALTYLIFEAMTGPVISRGIHATEMSWILEQNTRMRKVIESLGGKAYKRYRVYEKKLG